MAKVTRRSFVTTIGAAGVAPAAALLSTAAHGAPAVEENPATAPGRAAEPIYLFFSVAEALFIEAACERLIPADESGPGAVGRRGSQLSRQAVRRSMGRRGAAVSQRTLGGRAPRRRVTNCPSRRRNCFIPHFAPFIGTSECAAPRSTTCRRDAQDAYLKSLESGAHDLDGVPSAVFFDMLLKMTIEGFFSDPVYGGNRDMAAWRMIGFPGAYADYFETVDRHGVKFEREPYEPRGGRAASHPHASETFPRIYRGNPSAWRNV